MTEHDWLASADPHAMMRYLFPPTDADVGLAKQFRPSERKLRLWAAGCCRLAWGELANPRSRHAVEVAERYTDGKATSDEAAEAEVQANLVAQSIPGGAGWGAPWLPVWACATREGGMFWANLGHYARRLPAGAASLLRCVVGNPFRPVKVEPSWLRWNDSTVPKIARVIYDERAFDRLPILADSAEEAGCCEPDILNHLRGKVRCAYGYGPMPGNHEECTHCDKTGWFPAGPRCPECPTPRHCRKARQAGSPVCEQCGCTGYLPTVHARGCWVLDLLLSRS